MWKTILLIVALHGSATFDAWSTNHLINGRPPGWDTHELNPLLKPFAGKRSMYVAVNLPLVPLDIWLVKRPKSKRAQIVAGAFSASSMGFAIRNVKIHGHDWREWGKQQACHAQWVEFGILCSSQRLVGLVIHAGPVQEK